jgi:uncharacterized protein YciI
MMNQKWPIPEEIRLVSSEPTPEKLFVCSAKVNTEAGLALKQMFESGGDLPGDLKFTYKEHLIYTYNLGEKGSLYEAGPAADFTEILYIFSTDSIEKAQQLMYKDPFYKAGIFYGDCWFNWLIHSPRWRSNVEETIVGDAYRGVGIMPIYPGGAKPEIKEVKVDVLTPPKLFVSFCNMNNEVVKPPEEGSTTISMVTLQHFYYVSGMGGSGLMGYLWLAGPSSDFSQDLTILSVNSLQMAQLVKENDSLARYGVFQNIRYFEWCIHMPFKKASPTYRERLKRLLIGAGINLVDK